MTAHENGSDILLADELEALLAAYESGTSTVTSGALSPEDATIATTLQALANSITAGAELATRLEAQLRSNSAERVSERTGVQRLSLWRETVAVWREQGTAWIGGSAWRRVLVALALIVLLLGMTLAVPPARAALSRVLRLGGVTIFPNAPTVTSTEPTPTPLTSVLDLAGETTLSDARQQAQFTIRLPAYPADLGAPQRVFLQNLGGQAVVLVWLEPGHPSQVRMSLHELTSNIWVLKMAPRVIQETSVHGQRALWTDGPYIVEVVSPNQTDYAERRLVSGHVLIWTEGGITYRLETSASLQDAVRIAESLR
jgi:hypothetical protein